MKKFILLSIFISFSFGLIAQEQNVNPKLSFAILKSPQGNSLERTISIINQKKPNATLFLGDLTEKSEETFFHAIFHLNCLQMPIYTLAGDKDFALFSNDPQKAISALMMNSSYYTETFSLSEKEKWKFIFLDGGKISLFAWRKNSIPYNYAKNQLKKYPTASPNSGALGEEQRFWLTRELDKAVTQKEKVILFCHFPLLQEQADSLWDAPEVLEIIKNHPCVKGWISNSNESFLKNDGELFFLGIKKPEDGEPNFLLLKIFSQKIDFEGFKEKEILSFFY